MNMARESVRDALALMRGLVRQPEKLAALRPSGTDIIAVIERGRSGQEGELVAVRLMPEQRTALGRLVRQNGRMKWKPLDRRWATREVQPGKLQILGRVLSVIQSMEPKGHGQSQAARTAIRPD